MTTELKQAAQQALLALEKSQPDPSNPVIGLTKQDFIDHEETIRQLRAAIQQTEAQQPATGEPVQADSSEHLRVIASLGAALRRLSFAAQTTGGTDGPDAELQSAIGQAEQALSLGGIWQAMSATPEPVKATPYNPTEEMRWAMKRIDPALSSEQCRALWSAAWSVAPSTHPAPSVPATGEPVAWRNVIPGGRKTDEWESTRIADYNLGWNAYRKAAKTALEHLETSTQPLPSAWMYTLEYGGTIADTKVSLRQLNYPFGVCGADYLRENSDGISYVRQTPLYTHPAPIVPTTPEPVMDVRCEGCGYMTHHREHMGCVRAAKQHTRPVPSVPGDDFDLICNAIDKADTITMEGDYMLDSDDCIAVVRVMQVLLSVRAAMLAAKEGGAA